MAKSPSAFRTISEAAEEVGAPQHVLRFWETKFDFITPVKRAGGRRFYRPDDVMVLKAVRRLLHDEGLTIRGVQRLVRDQGLARVATYGDPSATLEIDSGLSSTSEAPTAGSAPDFDRLTQVLTELEEAHARLEAVLRR
ncbi:MerR family transcriptional regulator [Brevundimonas guildfordensis]|uniref:MerR family transcriptional regulator n=1 Tax=Brevundimonas guildfordensis TaxID=2762241 RepID=A0ABR8QY18_9CAUL|nr:MerR family transcriptional regulator [Brevundimonas guildfordensis]MBD7940414.1 MerR family transcriptional regulator [Brevundimonas guildfordensis]